MPSDDVWRQPNRPVEWEQEARPVEWEQEARGATWRLLVSQILVKRPGETRQYSFDFAGLAEVVAGQTLSAPTVTATPSGLTLGAVTISGSKAQLNISSGTDDTTYDLTCTVTTSGGATLVGRGQLAVEAG